MRIISLILILGLFVIHVKDVYSGFGSELSTGIVNSDFSHGPFLGTGTVNQLSAYYDLRQRSSYVQITNLNSSAITIHVQIFQHDRNCNELNFNDTLTPNDTVVYNLDNIIKNNGEAAPINLQDDSYGYVVVSIGDGSEILSHGESIIGNFRIVDDSGYEYRVNMAGVDLIESTFPTTTFYIANFNTVDGANKADVVGYTYYYSTNDHPAVFTSTVRNLNVDLPFSIFVFDLNEDPLSCDQRAFTCGKVMNYGINEDYPASRGEDLLCPGGGLADPDGGFISLEPTNIDQNILPNDLLSGTSVGLIGINNGDGTGSMDYWFVERFVTFSDKRLKTDINLVHNLDNGIKLYSFKYNDNLGAGDETFVGVMAQDLNNTDLGHTVVKMPNGYYAVDYNKIGLRMATLEEWEEKGLDSVVIDNNY
ncbi:MAG: hypothetical protein GTO02_12250 [Candidatus Dadabacteria bacterium]|nr:hypothetical protein [Candidatus Dadabacteria bacterium]NIQ15124.1 hypothetical protein [Candidatus Dadabacteria bacterium]